MKRGIKLAGALLLAAAAAQAGTTGVIEKITVTPEITEIRLDLENEADVTLVTTKDTFHIDQFEFSGAEGNPFSVERDGAALILKGKGHKKFLGLKRSTLVAKIRLLVPAGRKVRIAGGKLKLSGELSAADVKIAAGSLTIGGLSVASAGNIDIACGSADLDMSVSAAKGVNISSGKVAGKMVIPESIPVNTASGSDKLQVMLLEGK